MRKAGELIAEGQEKGEITTRRDNQYSDCSKLLLSDVGIDRTQSSRWQRLASETFPLPFSN